jgi:hypothetical protein
MKRSNSLKETKCTACDAEAFARFEGVPYCKKHYMQMYHKGKITTRTIYDPNEYILHDDYAECITYDKEGNETARVKVNLDKVEELKQYKVYIRKQGGDTWYAAISVNGKKVLLHRYLMGVHEGEYSIKCVVDHINGDKLDDRLENLRVCEHKDNMKNIRKGGKVIGVNQLRNGKWVARIMHNYQTINLGNYDNEQDAIIARLTKEFELCGDYGPNKDLYHLLGHCSNAREQA